MSKVGVTACRSREAVAAQAFGAFRLVGVVLLPFVTGYFLSYYFRTVNAVLATRLTSELSLTAAQLGLMTAAYFLTAAIAQLPIGWALDRFGPRRVQMVSLSLAAVGALLFAKAGDVPTLFGARALIGLGVASALLAGLKAIAMISPPSRLGLFNGVYMCIGALGALAASAPTEWLLQSLHWRDLFLLLAAGSLAAACLIGGLVPRGLVGASPVGAASAPRIGYREILRDRYFWRLAPLSATAIGGAWALQGLWSAPWLRDVAGMPAPTVARTLLLMALALSAGALAFGIILHRLAAAGIPAARTMAFAALTYIAAEVSLALAWPVPPVVAWCVISVFAAGTVLTYTMSAQHFPKESVGRANSAFNLLHFVAAFGVQSGFGAIIDQWPRDPSGHYPAEAYTMAFLCLVALQIPALLWFLRPVRSERAQRTLFGSVLPRLAAWALLACVAYYASRPYQAHITSKLGVFGPAQAVSAPSGNAMPIEDLAERWRRLEGRFAKQERELWELRREVNRLSDGERWREQLLDEAGHTLLYLSDGVWRLSERVEAVDGR